jgi:hypothetical protein
MSNTHAFAALQAHCAAEAHGSPSTLPTLPDAAASPLASFATPVALAGVLDHGLEGLGELSLPVGVML